MDFNGWATLGGWQTERFAFGILVQLAKRSPNVNGAIRRPVRREAGSQILNFPDGLGACLTEDTV